MQVTSSPRVRATPPSLGWSIFVWSTWAVSVLLAFAALVLLIITNGLGGGGNQPWLPFLLLPATLAFPSMAAVIGLRQPKHAVGWLMRVIGLLMPAEIVALAYAYQALTGAPGSLPRPELVTWLAQWAWVPGLLFGGTFLLLLFPNGRLPSPRWRPIFWAIALVMGLLILTGMFKPVLDSGTSTTKLMNPIGAPGVLGEILTSAYRVLDPLALASFFPCAVSLIVRFRGSAGIERQQLKWLAFVAGVMAAGTAVAVSARAVGLSPVSTVAGGIVWLGVSLLPLAVGLAILRYRLFDIDLVINRTLVYATTTIALALVYWGSVLVFQLLLRPFTPQSELAIVASTLSVAALFQPLRRRVQNAVDRRFYRRRYDMQRTLDAFSAHLREDVELHRLSNELVSVVQRTMQPSDVSLWLKPSIARRMR